MELFPYKVSFIMGIYNCAQTLQEALNSLYNQTFQDFEIIICDDGSVDESFNIAAKNKQEHHNIVLIKNPYNLGLNQTLNNCIKVAKGEFLARMDGDDISLPNRLREEVTFLDCHPEYAMVSCPMIYFDEKGDFKTGQSIEKPEKGDFVHGTPFCHAASVMRTSIVKKIGGYSVDRRLLRVEDYHLWIKLYSAGYKGYNLQEPLYKMRDDRNAYKRRNWQNRKNEIYVRHIGFKMLGLPWYTQLYALRPLIAHILPSWFYKFYHRK